MFCSFQINKNNIYEQYFVKNKNIIIINNFCFDQIQRNIELHDINICNTNKNNNNNKCN